jgi:hypothetical protein
MAVHERLAGGRWMELTLMEQLANVGSEVDRAIRAAAAGRIERRDRAWVGARCASDYMSVDT